MRPRAHPLCIRPHTLYKNLATRPNFFARSLVITVATQSSSGPKSSSCVQRAGSVCDASVFPRRNRTTGPVCAGAVVCSRCLLALQVDVQTGNRHKSLRAPTNFRVNKGDHHELAPGPATLVVYSSAVLVFCTPAILICYTIGASPPRFLAALLSCPPSPPSPHTPPPPPPHPHHHP